MKVKDASYEKAREKRAEYGRLRTCVDWEICPWCGLGLKQLKTPGLLSGNDIVIKCVACKYKLLRDDYYELMKKTKGAL